MTAGCHPEGVAASAEPSLGRPELVVRVALGKPWPYPRGTAWMHDARMEALDGGPDRLLVVEHAPVVTLGRRGGGVNRGALDRLGTPVVETRRGGLATWHGPGQLVAYPVVNVRRRGHDVPGLVRALGSAVVAAARVCGVEGRYDACRPGVYVEGRKVASLGLHLHKGVTAHGLALNVANGLEGFAAITPCGDDSLQVTTLNLERERLGLSPVTAAEVAPVLVAALRERI